MLIEKTKEDLNGINTQLMYRHPFVSSKRIWCESLLRNNVIVIVFVSVEHCTFHTCTQKDDEIRAKS